MVPEAGELDQRAVVLKRSSTRDSFGATSEAWVEAGTAWVKLAALTPRTTELAKGYADSVAYTALARHLPAVSDESKLQVSGLTYAVSGVVHDPAPRPWWTMMYLSRLGA